MPEDEAILAYLGDMGYVPTWFTSEDVWTRLRERNLVKPGTVELIPVSGDGYRFFKLFPVAVYVAAEGLYVSSHQCGDHSADSRPT